MRYLFIGVASFRIIDESLTSLTEFTSQKHRMAVECKRFVFSEIQYATKTLSLSCERKFHNFERKTHQLIYRFMMQKLATEALLHISNHFWKKKWRIQRKIPAQIEQMMVIQTRRIERQIKGKYEKKSTQERNVFSSFVKGKLFFVLPLVYSLKIKEQKVEKASNQETEGQVVSSCLLCICIHY